ncbi:MAG: hypothetical protein N2508_09020 [Anaerolineae bacterium]|nr:hypothetical protein [Anaerolineae bacterium]
MNLKFVLRGFLVALSAAIIFLLIGLTIIISRTPFWQPPAPTPPPPTILLPTGTLPARPVSFEEWVLYRGEEYVLAGSGFLLGLDDGRVVGVTAAHSVAIGDARRPPQKIALRLAGHDRFIAECDTFHGHPGRPFTDENDLRVDYLLLHLPVLVDPLLVLKADPRGLPQPGERIALFSGLGDGRGGLRVLEGTVQSSNESAGWALMDEWFYPGMMSGSPILSQHTGLVVGMAVACSLHRDYLLIGFHPIGSIVRQAESADGLYRIEEYRRE